MKCKPVFNRKLFLHKTIHFNITRMLDSVFKHIQNRRRRSELKHHLKDCHSLKQTIVRSLSLRRKREETSQEINTKCQNWWIHTVVGKGSKGWRYSECIRGLEANMMGKKLRALQPQHGAHTLAENKHGQRD